MSATETPGGAVRLDWLEGGIAVVAMEDRASKNRFSDALVEGLRAAFDRIERTEGARVVVVQGYDTYFCCGGTLEELLDLVEGRLRFTAFDYHDLLMRCELPTVAAMQGHAIGGGLVFGAYADLVVMAEECMYSANFMEYGFTPGLGATAVIPHRFGQTLGQEMLLTARNYHGGELRDRGAAVRVVPRAEVTREALELARDLARKPVVALRELKRALNETLRTRRDAAVPRELAMHEACFANPEVREMVTARYPR